MVQPLLAVGGEGRPVTRLRVEELPLAFPRDEKQGEQVRATHQRERRIHSGERGSCKGPQGHAGRNHGFRGGERLLAQSRSARGQPCIGPRQELPQHGMSIVGQDIA